MGAARLDDLTRVHDQHAVRDPSHHAEIMGDQQHRDAETLLQLDQQAEDLRLDGDVERGRWLVGDQQCRPAHQRHGDHNALAQSARELVRILGEPLGRRRDADLPQQLDGAVARLRPGRAGVPVVHLGELVADGVGRIERRHGLLEHHRHAIAAQVGEARFVRALEVFVLEHELSRGADRVAREEPHERIGRHGLTAAGFADEAQRLAARDGKRDIADRMQLPSPTMLMARTSTASAVPGIAISQNEKNM